MTQNKDRKATIRDRMAANNISYTQAARLIDLETGQAPARVPSSLTNPVQSTTQPVEVAGEP